MNSKQVRKERRKFMRSAGPKLVEARLFGVPQKELDFWVSRPHPAGNVGQLIKKYKHD